MKVESSSYARLFAHVDDDVPVQPITSCKINPNEHDGVRVGSGGQDQCACLNHFVLSRIYMFCGIIHEFGAIVSALRRMSSRIKSGTSVKGINIYKLT